MIAPALAPATFAQVVIGFVGCSAKPQSAPASASPLTPPPRKTPSASVIHSNAGSSHSAAGDEHQISRRLSMRSPARAARISLLLLRCYHVETDIATSVTHGAASARAPRVR